MNTQFTRKFSDGSVLSMEYSTTQILTTKITKATKVSDIYDSELRALRVLRGEIGIFFGYDSTALGCSW